MPIRTVDLGTKLLEVLRLQRDTFLRTADGQRLITNHLRYRQFEDEALEIQEKIGRENTRKLNKERNAS